MTHRAVGQRLGDAGGVLDQRRHGLELAAEVVELGVEALLEAGPGRLGGAHDRAGLEPARRSPDRRRGAGERVRGARRGARRSPAARRPGPGRCGDEPPGRSSSSALGDLRARRRPSSSGVRRRLVLGAALEALARPRPPGPAPRGRGRGRLRRLLEVGRARTDAGNGSSGSTRRRRSLASAGRGPGAPARRGAGPPRGRRGCAVPPPRRRGRAGRVCDPAMAASGAGHRVELAAEVGQGGRREPRPVLVGRRPPSALLGASRRAYLSGQFDPWRAVLSATVPPWRSRTSHHAGGAVADEQQVASAR